MRVEPFTVDSYVHAIKRGARGMSITSDKSDKDRFLRLLFFMNNEILDTNWSRLDSSQTAIKTIKNSPLVKVLAYCLMPNHFHIFLKEIKEGGISEFMKKVGQSMTNHFNEKYKQRGSIFQGSYRSRTVHDDNYFRYLAVYIMVKNPMELYPKGGLAGAIENFEEAWRWALDYKYSSLNDYVKGENNNNILDKDLLEELFLEPKAIKSFAKDCILGRKLDNIFLE